MPPIIKQLPPIPAERAIKVIGGRWKVVILYHLFEGPKRLSELRRLAPRASQKVLVQQLREMEEHGIVHREVFAQVPPRVEYTATKLGLSLKPIIGALCEWGRHHEEELNALDRAEAREQQDGSRRPPPMSRATEVRRPPLD
ncbi:winged helix-turn-helix transcriptional regulator [Myxococcus sp. Y35]|uniref:winged helix-turn-helix transcriptional regulator n=1 Tax=Pseudomyxococcus flavus TaxID=3115648 RepID=UPI003CEBC4D2